MNKSEILQLIMQKEEIGLQQVFVPPLSPKKRIHELSYARKVVQPISADKQHIKLNESLFNAKIAANQSTTFIKDIQKNVQQTIKKYDDFLRLSISNKKNTDQMCSSPSRMQPQTDEMDLQGFREEGEQALLNDLQKLTKSQEHRRMSMPVERSELRLSSYKVKEELFPSIDISPIKQEKSNHVMRKNSAGNLSTPLKTEKNNNQFQQDYYGSYAKIHRKKSPTSPPLFQQLQEKKIRPSDDVAKRNAEWKQKLQEKISTEQKLKEEKEIKACTFQPKIIDKERQPKVKNTSISKNDQDNNTNQFKVELQEIIHIIDDLNQFNKQLKKKK